MAAAVQCLVSGFELSMYMHIVHLWILLLTPECRVPESRWVGKLLTSIILLIGSNNAAARLTTINNIILLLWLKTGHYIYILLYYILHNGIVGID